MFIRYRLQLAADAYYITLAECYQSNEILATIFGDNGPEPDCDNL
jgi:hypothetical protein